MLFQFTLVGVTTQPPDSPARPVLPKGGITGDVGLCFDGQNRKIPKGSDSPTGDFTCHSKVSDSEEEAEKKGHVTFHPKRNSFPLADL